MYQFHTTKYSVGVEMFCTAKGGLWGAPSEDKNSQVVRVTKLELIEASIVEPDETITSYELRVYFDKRTWNINRNGLLYTDESFERDLRKGLRQLGYRGASAVDGSEQGMQGNTYFSGDVSKQFAKAFKADPDVQRSRTVIRD